MTISRSTKSVYIIAFTLLLATTIAGSATASPRVALPAIITAPQNPNIYTIKDAGLQFEVPKGWKAEIEDGNVVLSVADGAISVTFLVENDFEQTVTGMKNGLKEKLTQMKQDGERKQETHNGMTHLEESGSGLMKDVKITWSIDVLKATKNVTILTFGIDSILETHSEEYLKFVGSIKKI